MREVGSEGGEGGEHGVVCKAVETVATEVGGEGEEGAGEGEGGGVRGEGCEEGGVEGGDVDGGGWEEGEGWGGKVACAVRIQCRAGGLWRGSRGARPSRVDRVAAVMRVGWVKVEPPWTRRWRTARMGGWGGDGGMMERRSWAWSTSRVVECFEAMGVGGEEEAEDGSTRYTSRRMDEPPALMVSTSMGATMGAEGQRGGG